MEVFKSKFTAFVVVHTVQLIFLLSLLNIVFLQGEYCSMPYLIEVNRDVEYQVDGFENF